MKVFRMSARRWCRVLAGLSGRRAISAAEKAMRKGWEQGGHAVTDGTFGTSDWSQSVRLGDPGVDLLSRNGNRKRIRC